MTVLTQTLSAPLGTARSAAIGTDPGLADAARNVLMVAIGIQIALLVPSLLAMAIDERMLNGISIWSKPIKFQTSLILTLGTLVWLLPLVTPAARAARPVRWWALAASAMATAEIVYITLQAARGRASHFNLATPAENLLYTLMGVGAVIIVAGCFAIGWAIWRHGDRHASPGLRAGAATGLMVGAVLTLVTAGYLGSAGSHWVGGNPTDAGGLMLLGWSRSGGDLRVPHFFATHIMQALPLLGILLDRMPSRLARPGLIAGTVTGIAVVAATFAQALMGRPFL